MKRHNRKAHTNHERWLVSYADFITLMFAFFVVLYASSQTDIRKQAQVAQAINQAFKALGLFQPDSNAKSSTISTDKPVTPVNVVLGDELSAQPSAAVKADFERMHRELQARLSNQIAQHVVALRVGREGLVISLREAGFYDSGSTTPHPGSMGSIDSIVSILRPTPYDIRIEGHTDNVPIHTGEFASNWELSTARATRMARLFIERFQFDPRRLAAAGYAEYHPVASNESAEGRGQNRRVDIIVLPSIDGVPQTALAPSKPAAKDTARASNTPTAIHLLIPREISPGIMRAVAPISSSPAVDPRSLAETRYFEAVDCLARNDIAAAVEGFRASLEADRGYSDAAHGLLHALKAGGQFDEAVAVAQQLIAADPDDILAHTSLSILYQHQGKIAEAEAAATRAKLLGWKHELRQQKDTEGRG